MALPLVEPPGTPRGRAGLRRPLHRPGHTGDDPARADHQGRGPEEPEGGPGRGRTRPPRPRRVPGPPLRPGPQRPVGPDPERCGNHHPGGRRHPPARRVVRHARHQRPAVAHLGGEDGRTPAGLHRVRAREQSAHPPDPGRDLAHRTERVRRRLFLAHIRLQRDRAFGRRGHVHQGFPGDQPERGPARGLGRGLRHLRRHPPQRRRGTEDRRRLRRRALERLRDRTRLSPPAAHRALNSTDEPCRRGSFGTLPGRVRSTDTLYPVTETYSRTRFAPSPTGMFHVGGARSALFNWALAQQHLDGRMVLRVEYTDATRNRPDWTEGLIRALAWLAIGQVDPIFEGPYYHSAYVDKHRETAQDLYKIGRAYYCDCTREQVQERRGSAPLGYGGFCRDRGLEPGPARALRFRVPESGPTVVDDRIRGLVELDHAAIEDFVIARGDGSPLFVLANVVDDVQMRITHV